MLTGAETFHSHAALGFVVEHEQEILTPQLAFERGSAVLRGAAVLIAPAFTRFVEPDRAERLGEWVTRLTLPYLLNLSERCSSTIPRTRARSSTATAARRDPESVRSFESSERTRHDRI